MSLLKCGCELTIEGGYGDDGLSGRDTIEWCATHGAAERLEPALRALVAVVAHAVAQHPAEWIDHACRGCVGPDAAALAAAEFVCARHTAHAHHATHQPAGP